MSNLTRNIGIRVLKNRCKSLNRVKSLQNFDTAKSAVILFDTQIPHSFEPVKEFTKYLKSKGIKTRVYGFVEQKEIPQEMLLWSNYEYITKKETNWYGKPRGPVADSFYSRKPDILFVLSFQDHLTMQYLTQLSIAKFKIGCYTDSNNDYDFMINPSAKDCNIEFLIEQIKHYLHILNPVKK